MLRCLPLSSSCRRASALPFARIRSLTATTTASRADVKSYNLSNLNDSESPIRVTSKASHELEKITASSPDDLVVFPDYLSSAEQEILLDAALKKLESGLGSREERRRKKEWAKRTGQSTASGVLRGFLPESIYDFQERHFDGVISGYRETTLSSWPESASRDVLPSVLARMYSLLPQPKGAGQDATASPLATPAHLLTHLLHLASHGYILPHVDNLEASAGSIMGISLGVERELVLQLGEGESQEEVRVALTPGSAYLQRGSVRYNWKHSIPLPECTPSLTEQEQAKPGSGQRLSIMVRDRL